MNVNATFNEAMRMPAPKPAVMPPAEGGAGAEALRAWLDAIEGKAAAPTLSDTRGAAAQWQAQFDVTAPTVKVL